jgi:hypothetical protein
MSCTAVKVSDSELSCEQSFGDEHVACADANQRCCSFLAFLRLGCAQGRAGEFAVGRLLEADFFRRKVVTYVGCGVSRCERCRWEFVGWAAFLFYFVLVLLFALVFARKGVRSLVYSF